MIISNRFHPQDNCLMDLEFFPFPAAWNRYQGLLKECSMVLMETIILG